jgi:hypothetical protein
VYLGKKLRVMLPDVEGSLVFEGFEQIGFECFFDSGVHVNRHEMEGQILEIEDSFPMLLFI